MREAEDDRETDLHNAPWRQFGPGDLFLADDLTGQGHITRTIQLPRRSVVVPVPGDFDLDALHAFNTLEVGYGSSGEHIEAIRTFAEQYGVGK